MNKTFTVLLKFKAVADATLVRKLEAAHIKNIQPLVCSSTVINLGVTWDGTAHALWRRINKTGIEGLTEILVIACGDDWCGQSDKISSGWLVNHVGNPLAWADS